MKRILFGECVQGASHIRNNVECQDSIAKYEFEDGTVVMAVADGHGSSSCPYSKTGSKIAVNVFCRILVELYSNNKDNLDFLFTFFNREGDTRIAQAIDIEWKKRVIIAHRNKKREMLKLENGAINKEEIYKQYGTTLIGLIVTPLFYFSLQIGDGDIVIVNNRGVERVLESDKILGTETHSLSKKDSWKKAISVVRKLELSGESQLFMMSTDGFSNSFKNDDEYQNSCKDYYEMVNKYGVATIKSHLKEWLNETSEQGCGDDITLLMCYMV